MTQVNAHIFRAYDIRGIYEEDLTVEAAMLIGKGFGTYLEGYRSVVVGRDGRTHSPLLQRAFIDGLVSTGCTVSNIGLAPSPLLYFANIIGQFEAGCNITASHNPAEYNGFKLVGAGGHSICGDEIQKIRSIIEKGDFINGEGSVRNDSFLEAYTAKLQSMFHFNRPYKVVVDSGNGVTGAFYPDVMEKLGLDVIRLHTELDGTFPNHEPDPIVEANTVDLKKLVLEHGADIGISFDGDGDRMGVVDNEALFHKADETGMLLARDVLARHPAAKVVFTVSISETVFDDVREHGGETIMCKVGHSFVEQAMHEYQALLGVEQSGHIFIKEDYYGYDDALVAALRIIALLNIGNPMADLYCALPQSHIHPEIRPYCPDEQKFAVIEQVVQYFSKKYPCNTIDGVRIDFGDRAWAGIRVSNTSPRISICLDAPSAERLEEIKNIVLDHLRSYSEIDWSK